MNRRTFSVLFVAIAALASIPSAASAQGGPATRFLRARNEEIVTILREPASEARTTRVTAIFDDLLDYEELARRSLGTHWEGRTPAQRTEFTTLLRQLIERQAQASFERLLDVDITYVSEGEVEGGRTVALTARSRTERRAPPVEITYSAHQVGSAWRLFDITTDGVSMVRNYQQQFNRIITADGWDTLIERMRERLTR
jgi:phospholipid transport system substrate-binding protein